MISLNKANFYGKVSGAWLAEAAVVSNCQRTSSLQALDNALYVTKRSLRNIVENGSFLPVVSLSRYTFVVDIFWESYLTTDEILGSIRGFVKSILNKNRTDTNFSSIL